VPALLFVIMIFFFTDTATPVFYTLSYTTLFRSSADEHCDTRSARPSVSQNAIFSGIALYSLPMKNTFGSGRAATASRRRPSRSRSEEHTSELQSRENLVCRLLLEKKKTTHVIR